MFSIIVATDTSGGIGYHNNYDWQIPWKNKTDMKYFKNITINHNVIMGRTTYFTLPNGFLKDRTNIVITSNPSLITNNDVICFLTLNDALEFCSNTSCKTFVIGGAQLYTEALCNPNLDKLYWNIIRNDTKPCNIMFPVSIDIVLKMYNTKSFIITDDIIYYIFTRQKN